MTLLSLALNSVNRIANLGSAMIPHPVGVGHTKSSGLLLRVCLVGELVIVSSVPQLKIQISEKSKISNVAIQ